MGYENVSHQVRNVLNWKSNIAFDSRPLLNLITSFIDRRLTVPKITPLIYPAGAADLRSDIFDTFHPDRFYSSS